MPLVLAYSTRDAIKIHLMLLNPQPHWPRFCQIIDAPELVDDPKFIDNESRMANSDELICTAALAQRHAVRHHELSRCPAAAPSSG